MSITSNASIPKFCDLVTIDSKSGYDSGITIKGCLKAASVNLYLKVKDFKSSP
nr:MAG TPA: hypothetical protein [Caudoviricetes sp.]